MTCLTLYILQTALAVASAPLHNISYLPHVIFWIWFHLLQFDVSNQTTDPEEDKRNKPYRPIPAKRITLQNARILRWILVPAGWVLSSCYSIETVYASIGVCVFTYGYNEIGFSSGHWFGRNLFNALGLSWFEIGACLILGNSALLLNSRHTDYLFLGNYRLK